MRVDHGASFYVDFGGGIAGGTGLGKLALRASFGGGRHDDDDLQVLECMAKIISVTPPLCEKNLIIF